MTTGELGFSNGASGWKQNFSVELLAVLQSKQKYLAWHVLLSWA